MAALRKGLLALWAVTAVAVVVLCIRRLGPFGNQPAGVGWSGDEADSASLVGMTPGAG